MAANSTSDGIFKALEASGWIPETESPFLHLVGPLWTKREGADQRWAFVAQTKHTNINGFVHGGMLAAFADHALALVARNAQGNQPQVTIQLSVQFISPVRAGELVEAHCRVLKQAGSIIFVQGDFIVDTWIVASATGVWKIQRR